MTPREREIRSIVKECLELFGPGKSCLWLDLSDVTYLLAQLTAAREVIEVAKGAITDNRNHWHHIDADPNGKCTACNALAKITEMEKEHG